MEKEDISFGDWQRWLFGDAPPAFMGEVLLRAVIMFVAVVVLMRLMGRRMKGEISIAELAVVLTFGAIIGGTMHQPTAGLLPGLLVLGAVLFMHRFTNWLAFKYHALEALEQGHAAVLLRDGVLDLAAMQQHALSQEQLFGLLRNENISQLGELRRVYFEVSGELSIYKLPAPVPGLSVLPRADAPAAAPAGPAHGYAACGACGQVPPARYGHASGHAHGPCQRCGAVSWQPAAWQAKKEA
jgi:uncharacterized membrane protein YcaP (DUF421 family)